MAETFWKGLTDSLPPHLYDLREKIINSMLVGLVLFVFGEGFEPRQSEVRMVPERLDWIEDTFRPLCTT
jgi:hypothetical protein